MRIQTDYLLSTYYHLFIRIQSLHNFISYFDYCYLENPTVVTFFDFSSLSTGTQNILKHAAELLQFIFQYKYCQTHWWSFSYLLPRFLVGFVLLDLLFYVYVLWIVVCPFVLFLLAIVLSVLLRYTDSDCPFGIFRLYLHSI